jgi:hypothetical protein
LRRQSAEAERLVLPGPEETNVFCGFIAESGERAS